MRPSGAIFVTSHWALAERGVANDEARPLTVPGRTRDRRCDYPGVSSL